MSNYTRNPTWQDFPTTSTPITAAKLNHIEDGIAAVVGVADTSFIRDVTGAPTTATTNDALTFKQTRGGSVPQGDAMFVIQDASQSAPYVEQFFLTDNGGLETGRWIVCSQKRASAIGGVAANGARIQGVSSTSDGSEPSMISASCDVDGPAFAGECYTNQVTNKNHSAFAAYDLNDISGGGTSYSPGYGKKKFVIRGDGGLWWGANLQKDLPANVDLKLERGGAGILVLSTPTAATPTFLKIGGIAGQPTGITFASNGTSDNLQIYTSGSSLDYAEWNLHGRAIVRFYGNPVGVSAGGCIAVGGVNDVNAIITAAVDSTANASVKGIVSRGKSGQTGRLFEVQDSTPTFLSGFDKNGYFVTAKHAAPADADVGTGECFLWFDQTIGATKLMVKGKDSGGTVRTATIAMA